MILLVGSIVLALCTLSSTWLLARKQSLGFWIILGSQVIWTGYDILTHQYGFLILTPLMIYISIKGLKEYKTDA